ncbi:MAG: response regulator [Herminiimonas sp.]|nr:response regulator [Herminiimonas sp.]
MSRANFVLVVEDNDGDFETVIEAIRLAGVTNEVRRAYSGTESLEQMRDCLRNQTSLPALVLLDLNTPNDDGRSALLHMKSDEKLRSVPIVVISGSLNPRDVNFCYHQGLSAYHVKSVDHATHLQTLKTIFIYWLTMVLLPLERELEK